jgi:hypothetical protein
VRRLKLVAIFTAAVTLAGTAIAAPAWATVDDVAIVVIDHFSVLPAKPREVPPTANCPYLPGEVSNVVGDSGAGDDLPEGVAHGVAVQSRLSAQLDGSAALGRLPTTTDLTPYGLAGMTGISAEAERWRYGAHELTLIGMRTDGLTTADLQSRIVAVTQALASSPRGISRVVLNMSFVIAPCNVPAWLNEIHRFDGQQTLAAYRALIDEHPELEGLRDELDKLAADPNPDPRLLWPAPDDPLLALRAQLAVGQFYGLPDPEAQPVPWAAKRRLDSDPLKPLLAKLTASAPVVPVGAAGNGLLVYDGAKLVRTHFDFPFAPALWNPVVSVSASGDNSRRAAYSNNGEVAMQGTTWVTRADGSVATVHGTSFAAPRLSASIALHLLAGGPSPCDGHTPVLGYTNSNLAGQHWDDLSLYAAAKMYCAAYLG